MNSEVGPRTAAVLAKHGLASMAQAKWRPDCPIAREIDDARMEDATYGPLDPAKKASMERIQAFCRICPVEMQKTDVSKIPAQEASLQKVLTHSNGAKGLIVRGVSGSGKSRAVWMLVKRLIVDEGLSVHYDSSFEFGAGASDAYRHGSEQEWIRERVTPDVLFLDDLGKSKFTARVGEALFEIVDRRTSRGLPIFITTNFIGANLKSRFDDQELAEPLLRRLREFCEDVVLTKK